MRTVIAATLSLLALCAAAAAQDAAPGGSASGEPLRVPAAVGTIVRGYIQNHDGQAVVGEVQLVGSSPDDLFTYWVGYDGTEHFGFDVYREVWRPGPAKYIPATLGFQSGTLDGWLRSFGGMVDRDFFFGQDGVVYQRFYNEIGGEVVYSYFVHTATGQRSDSPELLSSVVTTPGMAQLITAQQSSQIEKFLAGFPERDMDFPYWRKYGNTLPETLPSLVTWGAPATGLERQLPKGQPSLLELIEEEVGPIHPEDDPPAVEEPAEDTSESGEPAGAGDSGSG